MIIESGYFGMRRDTAIYPGAVTGGTDEIMYLSLGLCSEMAELAAPGATPVPELGDVAWYMVGLADVAGCAQGIDSILMADAAPEMPVTRQDTILQGLIEAGHIAGVAKKLFRDGAPDGHVASDYPGLVLIPHLTRFAKVFRAMAAAHDIHPTRILEKNMDKLLSRKERDVLGGSGDER